MFTLAQTMPTPLAPAEGPATGPGALTNPATAAATARAVTSRPTATRAATSQPGRRSANGIPQLEERAIMLSDDGRYYIDRYFWFERWPEQDVLIQAAGVLFLIPLVAYLLTRMFRSHLEPHRLMRPIRVGSIAAGIYAALWIVKMRRLMDAKDVLSLAIHKIFVAIVLIVGIRLIDRLVVIPLLTRGGKATLSRFVHQIIVGVVTGFVALGYANWAFGVDVSSFLAGSAVISIVLGLALQETLGNFFSGMVIQASVPFQPGHWIRIGSVEGRVIEMTWRAVTLHTLDDNYVLIPNAMIAKDQIVNYSVPSSATARSVIIGLEYGISPSQAKRVLLAAAMETEGVLPEPLPRVLLETYADSSINYRIKFWINEPRRYAELENAVRVNAWYRLKQAGLNIPFPMRTVEYASLEKKQARLQADEREARVRILQEQALLASLSREQCEALATDTREVLLGPGQILYRQGDTGDSFFILREGEVESVVALPDGKQVSLGGIGTGQFFGEYSAVTGQPRPTTIRAVTDVKCIEITRLHLQEIFVADPGLMAKISEVVAQRQAEREAKLQACGANVDVQPEAARARNVLDRMKKMFGSLGALSTRLSL